MNILKNVLVASTFETDYIAIIEINTEFIKLINKALDAIKAIKNNGLESVILKIPINNEIILDFYKITSTHKKSFERGINNYQYGSLEYYSLCERDRIELKPENENAIDWIILPYKYDTIFIDENTIPGFARKFTNRHYMIIEGDSINIECNDDSIPRLSETISISELKKRIKK